MEMMNERYQQKYLFDVQCKYVVCVDWSRIERLVASFGDARNDRMGGIYFHQLYTQNLPQIKMLLNGTIILVINQMSKVETCLLFQFENRDLSIHAQKGVPLKRCKYGHYENKLMATDNITNLRRYYLTYIKYHIDILKT